jgi:hypothetical protein
MRMRSIQKTPRRVTTAKDHAKKRASHVNIDKSTLTMTIFRPGFLAADNDQLTDGGRCVTPEPPAGVAGRPLGRAHGCACHSRMQSSFCRFSSAFRSQYLANQSLFGAPCRSRAMMLSFQWS